MAVTAAPIPQLGRIRPALSFVLCIVFLGLHHWWAITEGEIYPKLLLFLFMVAGWAAGGVLYPPSFYSLTKFAPHLPTSMKVLGAIFAFAGFGLGFYVMLTFYS